jgi:antitoxin Phd
MYMCCMSTINITDARSHLPELFEKAGPEPVFIERRGHRAAVSTIVDLLVHLDLRP